MNHNTYTAVDLERDMAEIDEAIITHSKIIENLRLERYELLARKSDWEMQEVFEYAVENGFAPGEVMELLISSTARKMARNAQ